MKTYRVKIEGLPAIVAQVEEITEPEPEPDVPSIDGLRGFKMQAASCSDAAEGTGRVKLLADAGSNAIYYVVYWREFYYPTAHAPHRAFDSLAHVVSEAGKRGMQVYALLPAADMGWRENPKWNARTNYSGVTENWLDFTIPAARQWLADLCIEIVTGYDIDGIAMDFLRWHHWYKDAGLTPEPINQTMQLIHSSIKATRPDMPVIATPVADPDYAAEWRAQDWMMWLDKGWNDYAQVLAYLTVEEDMVKRQSGRIETYRKTPHWPNRIMPRLSLRRFSPETDRTIPDIMADIKLWTDAGSIATALFDDRFLVGRPELVAALAGGGW